MSKSSGLIAEFKKFIARGNVMDMAVGVVIGGAFSAIVTAIVNNIVMPLISFGTAGIDFTDMKLVLRPAVVVDGVETTAECAVGYGVLIQSIIYFLLVAVSIFLIIQLLYHNKHKREAAAAVKAKADADAAKLAADAAAADTKARTEAIEAREAHVEAILGEIRDLLKKQSDT